jgi:uracil-DNA glycosylase
VSLDLDDRQRAILREMNVEVWWPKPAALVEEPVAHIAKPPPVVASPVRVERVTVMPPAVQPVRQIQSVSLSTSAPASTLSWPDLQQAVATCQACALCEGRQHTVFGVGQTAPDAQTAPQVDWLIVGEAPGENEDRTGEPFVGQAGQLLDNMLKAMGLSRRENVYIVNVIKCRPPGNRNPEAAEIAQCEPYLRRQIELLQPKVILAMGRYAANSLLQMSVPDVHKLALGKLRGQVYHYDSTGRQVPVIATYHPAYLLRNLPEKAKAWADMCLAIQVMKQQGESLKQG